MATASDEFLVRLRYWLVSGGMITRIACGMTTSRSVGPARRPSASRRLGLAVRDRQDAGAHDLGDEGGGVDRQAEQQRHELRQDLRCRREVEAARARGKSNAIGQPERRR